tara:strand:- start:348 stop:452 length:105 start_codon:yes stop_codon:yes gene_type:complete
MRKVTNSFFMVVDCRCREEEEKMKKNGDGDDVYK